MMKIYEVDIDTIKENEYNPKRMNSFEEEELTRSIEKFGIVDPLVVNSNEKRKNILIGGHQRLKILKKLGYKKVPVVYINIDDIEKEKELCLRLSKNTGSFDWHKLLSEFSEDFLKSVGFSRSELTKMENLVLSVKDDIKKFLEQEKNPEFLSQEEPENSEVLRNIEEDDKKALVMNNYLVNFPSTNKYEIPDLIPERIFNKPLDDDLGVFLTRKGSEELEKPQVVLYRHRKQVKKTENKILAFFLYDYEFNNVWSEAYNKAKELSEKKWLAVMSPDFSIAESDPIALQIYEVFRLRYIDRYLQEFGIDIIPLMSFICFSNRALDFSFAGLPYNCPTIGIQIHTLNEKEYSKEQQDRMRMQLYYIKERVNPQQVLVYGIRSYYDDFKQVFDRVIFIPPFYEEAYLRVKKQHKELAEYNKQLNIKF